MTDNQAPITAIRDAHGRFVPGSGGRPLGAKNKVSREALEQIKAMKDGAIQKLWESVQRGEEWSIRFVLNKVLPAARTVEMEGVTPLDVQSALNAGDISPEEGKALASAIKNLREIDAIETIEARVTELEGAVQHAER